LSDAIKVKFREIQAITGVIPDEKIGEFWTKAFSADGYKEGNMARNLKFAQPTEWNTESLIVVLDE